MDSGICHRAHQSTGAVSGNASGRTAVFRTPTDVPQARMPAIVRAGSSGNAGIGSHLEATDAAEGHAGQVEGPGSSGNAGIGSHPAATGAAEGHAGQVEGPGSSEFTKNG